MQSRFLLPQSDSLFMSAGTTALTIHFDGGSTPSPRDGERYGSYSISNGEEIVLRAQRVTFGIGSCNEAEYLTLKASLLDLIGEVGLGARQISLIIFSDSNLVVNQVNGRWKSKNPRMRLLRDEVRALLDQFLAWQLSWNSRNVNVEKFGH